MSNGDLKKAINAVNNQLIQISYRWKIFRQLFDSGQENIELLNKTGSNVFELMQRLILDDVMMTLSRLTDREKSSGDENASINNVVAKARASLSPTTINDIGDLLNKLGTQVTNVRKHRNKVLAHADMTHAISVSLLPPVTYDELEKALKLLKEILSKVALEACKWTIPVDYNVIIPFGCSGDLLLSALKRAHK